jgi:hypothetical protein
MEAEKLILEAWRREADRAQKRLERVEDQLAGVVTLSLGTAVIGIGAVGYVGQHRGSPLDFMPIAGILLLGVAGMVSSGARVRIHSSMQSPRLPPQRKVSASDPDIAEATTLRDLTKLEQERNTCTEQRCSTGTRFLIGGLIAYVSGVLLIAVAVYIAVPSDPRRSDSREGTASSHFVPHSISATEAAHDVTAASRHW